MNLAALLHSPLTDRLGWTFLHSLWQGAAIALLATFLLHALKSRSANARYLVAAASLLALLSVTVLTFVLLAPAKPAAPLTALAPVVSIAPVPHVDLGAPISSAAAQSFPAISAAPAAPARFHLSTLFPYMVLLWSMGVLLLTLYHAGGWLAAQRLRSLRTSPADGSLQATLARLADRFHLRRTPHIRHSPLITTPLTLGHFRPLILLPLSLLSNLPADHLEALLAHELAHIRRHDYLINLLQTLIETLLFYHPAVWFLSRQIRLERELCCDDLAAQITNPLTYAQALLHLAENAMHATPAFTLAATGPTLLPRIQRLLGQNTPRPTPVAALLLCLTVLLLPLLPTIHNAHAQAPASQPTSRPTSRPATTRAASLTPPAPPIYSPGTLEGTFLLPDGSPAKDVTVVPNTPVNNNGGAQLIYFNTQKTDAAGRFTLPKAPAGALVDLYVQSPDLRFAFAAELPTKAQAAPQNLGTFTLQPTASATFLIHDAHGTPFRNTDINVQPTFAKNGLGNMTRKFTTDAAGRLHPDGLLAGMHYKLNRPGNGTYVDVVPIPADKSPALTNVTLDDHYRLQVLDAAGKPVRINDILSITVTITDGTWNLGPKPQIIDRLTDHSVLIDRQQLALAHWGTPVTLRYRDAQNLPAVATAVFPGQTGLLQLTVSSTTVRPYTLSNPPRPAPQNTVAGRIVDTSGNPIANATLSVPDFSSPITPGKTKTLATTGPDGLFQISTASTHYRFFQIDAPGYGRQWILTEDLPAGQSVDIPLDNTTHLQLTLLRPDGSPASGASLTAVTSITSIASDWGGQADLKISATADASGKIDLPLSNHTWELRIAGNDSLYARLPGITLTPGKPLQKTITLTPGVHLTLRTVDSVTGQPIPNATVALEDWSPGIIRLVPGTQRTTNADGLADWTSLMPGGQSFYVGADGYVRHFSSDDGSGVRSGIQDLYFNLTPHMHEITVRLEKGMRLTGQVTDLAGHPVPGVFANIGGLSTGDRRFMRPTNKDGQFDLLVPPDNGYQHGDYTLDIFLKPGDEKPVISSDPFDPAAGTEKSFTLTYPANAPLPPAPATAPATQGSAPVTPNVFSADNTPATNFTVVVLDPPGNPPPPRQIFAFAPNVGISPPLPGLSTHSPDLHLAPAIDTEVSLQLPDGSPAANIAVRPTLILFPDPASPIGTPLFLPDSISKTLAVTTDAAGHALFHGLPKNATVRFDIDDPRFAHISPRSQSPLEGDPTLIHIALPKLTPAASISGRVIDPQTHQPLANATISAHALSLDLAVVRQNAISDANGNFTISRLLPADYILTLRPPESFPGIAPSIHLRLAAGQSATAAFTLSSGALLRGQVLDPTSRQPVAHVGIAVASSTAASDLTTSSNANGHFELRVPPGTIHPYITAAPDGYLNTLNDPIKDFTLAEGQSTDLTLTLLPDPAPLIQGAVLDPDNHPVPNAIITPQIRDSFLHPYTSDANGRFHLHAYTGTLLRARAKDLATTQPAAIVEGKPVTLHLRKNATFSLTVTVLDESNHPIPNASLDIESDYGDFGESGPPRAVGPTGSIRLDALPIDRSYVFSATAPNFGRAYQRFDPAAGTEKSFTLTLPAPVTQPSTQAANSPSPLPSASR